MLMYHDGPSSKIIRRAQPSRDSTADSKVLGLAEKPHAAVPMKRGPVTHESWRARQFDRELHPFLPPALQTQ